MSKTSKTKTPLTLADRIALRTKRWVGRYVTTACAGQMFHGDGSKAYYGTVKSIDAQGRAVVRFENGTTRAVDITGISQVHR